MGGTDYHFGPQWTQEGVRLRLWAPSAKSVHVVIGNAAPAPMPAKQDGWHEAFVKGAKPGDRYCFLVNGEVRVPDPASRFQPDDADGQSELVASNRFAWSDRSWRGRPFEEAVIYELHIGCFSPQGNYQGIEEKLDYLAELGVTAIELMPIADFAGQRGWGYDGVLPYAPDAAYGRPDDLKRLVDAAHKRGIMMFLDVVYNHFGPSGNYLHSYAEDFFTAHYKTPWGAAINFEAKKPVRDFFIENALYWLTEFHCDGLRLDAVHAISDSSPRHFLNELAATVREKLGRERHIHLILENDKNEAHLLSYQDNAPVAYSAQWDDDIHHAFHVLLTGETEGYYEDYKENPLERLGRCLTQGFDYQGQPSPHRKGEARGEKSGHLPPQAFVSFLQNHDQIGNRALGDRIGALLSAEKRALGMAILLLNPHPPMLFMGEEWNASTPFLFFCDFHGELADAVREGRRREFAAFPQFADPAMRALIPDPNAAETFQKSKLDWQEKDRGFHAAQLEMVTKLLRLRRDRIAGLLKQGCPHSSFDVIEGRGLQARWRFGSDALFLQANFSDLALPAVLEGEIIWGEKGDHLAPWRCRWSVSARHV